jgi:hypothetical protein
MGYRYIIYNCVCQQGLFIQLLLVEPLKPLVLIYNLSSCPLFAFLDKGT